MWISFLYGLQAVGALLATKLLKVSLHQTLLPILLLVLGALVCYAISRLNRFTSKTIWRFWIPASIYALFIFILSHTSFSTGPISFNTNLFHPVEYTTLGLFIAWGWCPLLQTRGRKPFAMALFFTGMLFAISDEIHQAFVPGRTPSFVDLGWDFVGLCLAYVLFLGLVHVFQNVRGAPTTR